MAASGCFTNKTFSCFKLKVLLVKQPLAAIKITEAAIHKCFLKKPKVKK